MLLNKKEGKKSKRKVISYVMILLLIAFLGILFSYQKTLQKNNKIKAIDGKWIAPSAVLNMTEYDWGNISRDEIVEKSFMLTNQGNTGLEISRLVTSCGCTTAKLFLDQQELSIPAIIPSNEIGIITVRFDPNLHDSRGETKRAIRIETNDPQNPFLIINLLSNVK